MAVEAELKLLLPEDSLRSLVEHPLLKRLSAGEGREKQLYSTYFDTPELELLEKGAGLRVRRVDERWIQTLKFGGSGAGGLHRRQEWEAEVAAEAVDLDALPAEALKELSPGAGFRDRIAPVFVTEFRRLAWNLEPDADTLIEMALDQGEVRTPRGTVPLCELELELKRGNLEWLYRIGLELADSIPLSLGNASKAERGYAFYRPVSAAPPAAEMPDLGHDMTVAKAYATLLEHYYQRLLVTEAAIMRDATVAAVQALYAATSDLLTVTGFFPASVGTPPKRLVNFLEKLRQHVRMVGNWDLFLAGAPAALLQDCPEHPHLEALTGPAAERRGLRLQKLMALLQSADYTRAVLGFGKWLLEREDSGKKPAVTPFAKFASGRLTRHHKQLAGKGRRLRELGYGGTVRLYESVCSLHTAATWAVAVAPRRDDPDAWAHLCALGHLQGALRDQLNSRWERRWLKELGRELPPPLSRLLNDRWESVCRVRKRTVRTVWKSYLTRGRFW